MDHPRIVQTPDICFGKPRIADTRIPVAVLIEAVAAEGSLAKAAEVYACDVDDVKAALLFAADRMWGRRDLDGLFDGADEVIAAE